MTTSSAETLPAILPLIAHDVRWQLLRTLALSDYRVQELVSRIGRPLNLISYHLKQLRLHQLVSERRSSADARDIYYHLDVERLRTLYRASAEALHPALMSGQVLQAAEQDLSVGPLARILFLCTHNSARSQMAEGITRPKHNCVTDFQEPISQTKFIHYFHCRRVKCIAPKVTVKVQV
jgi:ArsR family transcriptional regulator, arsenate/arsenite/antimonite-responsive transcriptional repressor / arsenate reductase (thioredoxin)